MSAPTHAHEKRCQDLAILAALAGIRAPICLGTEIEPDVARIDLPRRILFVGDAKETETPGSWATQRRLGRYAAAALPVALAGAVVAFAVAHPRPRAARRWSRLLRDVLGGAGLLPVSASSCILDTETTVTLVLAVAAPARFRPAPALSSAACLASRDTVVDRCARSTSSAAPAA